MMKFSAKYLGVFVLLAIFGAMFSGSTSHAQSRTIAVSGDVEYVHDPSFIKDGELIGSS